MRNQVRQAAIASAFAAALLGGSAHAATTVFTDKSTFLAGLTTTITDDYAGYQSLQTDAQMSSVLGQTKYASTNDKNFIVGGMLDVVGAGCGGGNEHVNSCTAVSPIHDLNFATTSLSAGGSVFAVGFDYLNLDGGVATVTFGDGSQQVLTLLAPIYPTFPDTTLKSRFVGVQSSLGIVSIDFAAVLQHGHDYNTDEPFDYYRGEAFADNLTIGSNGSTSAVPEPATWAMMITGFFGVGALARRKARVLAA